MYPSERARLATNAITHLMELADATTAQIAIGRPLDAGGVAPYCTELIRQVFRADGYHQMGELGFLQSFFDDSFNLTDNDTWLKTNENTQGPVDEAIPKFLIHACAYDSQHATNFGVQMVDTIRTLLEIVLEADGETVFAEKSFRDRVLGTLTQYVLAMASSKGSGQHLSNA